MSNFVKIGQLVAKILRFFDFSRWQPPPSWIFEIKYCTAVEVVDVITRDKFFSDRLRDVDSVGGQIYRVPIG